MDVVEKTGKTVEEALEAAVNELGVDRNRVEYEVVEEPNKGLFGLIGVKPAKVRVVLKTVDPADAGRKFLDDVFSAMNLQVTVEKTGEANDITFNFRGNDLGLLIGKRGQTLDALQYLTNLAANRDAEKRVRIILDVEDYRRRRAETLKRLAERLADRVKRRGERVVLEPMSPHERKIIHTALQNDHRVVTFSEGEEPFRKVVISLKR